MNLYDQDTLNLNPQQESWVILHTLQRWMAQLSSGSSKTFDQIRSGVQA